MSQRRFLTGLFFTLVVSGDGLKIANVDKGSGGAVSVGRGDAFSAAAAPAPAPVVADEPEPEVAPTMYDKNGVDWTEGMCASRERQSPINFDTHLEEPAQDTLQYHYQPLRNVQLQFQAVKGLMFIDTSSIQVGSVVFDGKYFPLSRIDFHVGSEHLIRGERFAMEIQLVHRRIDDPMKQLIIGIPVWSQNFPQPDPLPAALLRQRRRGLYYPPVQNDLDFNPNLQLFLNRRPPSAEDEIVPVVIPWSEPLDLGSFVQNLYDTESGTYIQYTGSLTTPPCSDTTTWFVRRNPMVASSTQTQEFAKAAYLLSNKKGNFRAVMPVNRRGLAVYRAQWVPYTKPGLEFLPLGPNARTDGEYEAAELAHQAHELSHDALDYMSDFSDRLMRSSGNLTYYINKAERMMVTTPPPSTILAKHMMNNVRWSQAVLKTRAAIQSIANNVQSTVDTHMRKQTMKLHKSSAEEANKARMLTKAWIPAPAPPAAAPR